MTEATSDNPLLLDTCALIWSDLDLLQAATRAELERRRALGETIYISPISALEIGLLFAAGRLRSERSPQAFFNAVLASGCIRLAPMPPEVLINASFLPGSPPRDPFDRVLIATAREYGFTLMSRDRRLLEYAAAGHLRALAC